MEVSKGFNQVSDIIFVLKNTVMKPTPTVDSVVQANYLAVAPGNIPQSLKILTCEHFIPDFLRGVEVCAETVPGSCGGQASESRVA